MRRSKLLLTVLLAVILSLSAVAPAGAVTGTFVKDTEHPFVGLVVFYNANGDFVWRCSGSLLTPTVFLTAGHCADTVGGAVTARVYFQQDAGANYNPTLGYDPVTGYPNTCAAGTLGTLCATSDQLYNFDYPGGLRIPDTHDVGLVILDQPIFLSEYGSLAVAGSLDKLATQRGQQNLTFTVSGYGVSYVNEAHTGKPTISYRERLMALSQLVNLRSMLTNGFSLQTQGNGTGQGGSCFGDSGGPVFYGGLTSNTIVGVNSFVMNELCRGTSFAFRTDQQVVIDWILKTVAASGTQYTDIKFVQI